ncbi:MAG: alpha/beta hydrolase [Comamonas sp.]
MQIHPELAAVLAFFKDMPPVDWSQPMARIRPLMDQAGLPADVPMHEVRALAIPAAPGSSTDIPARLYRPTDNPAAPLLVFFHGGGWCFGTLDTHDGLCRHLAQLTGYNVCSVAYRLAPEHPFPAPLDDCYAATRWLAAHAAELQSDAGQLCLAGDSAGGNLAVATSLRARADGWNGIRAQLLLYPVCDVRGDTESYRLFGDMPLLSSAGMAAMWRHYHPATPAHPLASVLQAEDLRGLPATVIVSAELDILRDEAEQLARRLADAGVPTQLTRAAGMAHGFASFSLASPAIAGMLAEACEQLKAAVATPGAAAPGVTTPGVPA